MKITLKASDFVRVIATIAIIASILLPRPAAAAQLIGYWAGWARLPLSQISSNYDVIEVAFATPASDGATLSLVVNAGTEPQAQFVTDIASLKAQGKKVVLSIGGATATNLALNASNIGAFETSAKALIDTDGFNGIDLDLENSTLNLNAGDNDIANPTTPSTVYLIQACRDLQAHYGSGFMITMAPETAYVDGYGTYGTVSGLGWGSYLPLIYNIRPILTSVDTQDYNSGTMYGPDGVIYTDGTQDFDVALTDLLLAGYTLANGQAFPALAQNQVAFGVPATSGSAHKGYLTPAQDLQVAQYLGSGTSFGGAYHLRNPGGYSNFAGMMDWDINDDQGAGYAIANTVAPYLHSIGGGTTGGGAPAVPTGVTATGGNAQVSLSWGASTGATSYNIFRSTSSGGEGTTPYKSGITTTSNVDTGLTNGATYYYKVSAVNATGQSGQSGEVSATPNTPPAAPSGLTATVISKSQINLAWTDNATNATGYSVNRSTDNVTFSVVATLGSTATSYSNTGLTKSTTYYYKVNAFNGGGSSAFSNTASGTTPNH